MGALDADVARLRQVLAAQLGPTLVVGHSYGGQIMTAMTALGTETSNIVGLVYVSAFGLDEGESIGALLAQGKPTPAFANRRIDDQGFASRRKTSSNISRPTSIRSTPTSCTPCSSRSLRRLSVK